MVRLLAIALPLVAAACGRLGFAITDDGGTDNGTDSSESGDAAITCEGRIVESVPMSGLVSADLSALTGDASGSCGGAGVPDRIYQYEIPVGGSQLIVSTDLQGTTSDTLVYARTLCAPTTELICDGDGGVGAQSAFRIGPLPEGPVYVFIDGNLGASGHYDAAFELLLPADAACASPVPARRCGPELACMGGTCQPAGCTVASMHTGNFALTGVTTSAINVHAGVCGEGNDGGSRAPELVYQLTLAAAVTNVQLSTDSPTTDFDTLIYMRADCTGAQVACDDDSGTNFTSVADSGPLPAGTYDIFVDGFSNGSGTAQLTVTVTP